MNISLIGNSALRCAIQQNLVSFPSQVPAFLNRPTDSQERIAQLYFARGWAVKTICERYSLSKAMVQKLLSEWRIRAIAAGYIQDINPEDLQALAFVKDQADFPLPGYSDREYTAAGQLLPSTGAASSASQASV